MMCNHATLTLRPPAHALHIGGEVKAMPNSHWLDGNWLRPGGVFLSLLLSRENNEHGQ